MTVHLKEKSAISADEAAAAEKQGESARLDQADEGFDSKDGLRIAGQFLLREVAHYSGQAALVVALVAVIAGAGYWSLREMRSLPQFLNQIAKPFLPPPAPVAPVQSAESKALAEKAERAAHAEKTRLAALPKKHHRHVGKAPPPKYYGRRPGFAPISDEPTGGHIIYQDPVITEYRWNK